MIAVNWWAFGAGMIFAVAMGLFYAWVVHWALAQKEPR